jgi:hypothetical protein
MAQEFGGKKRSADWFHIPAQAVVLGFCIYWYFHSPVPNKAVLILTGVTVIIALLDMRPSHKAVYLLLVFALMFIENRAINKDHAKAVEAEDRRQKNEGDKFNEIASGLRVAIQQGQAQFDTTIGRANAILDATQKNLLSITGGNSFAYVAPQNFFGDEFPGVVWNNGEQALSGLWLTIAHTSDPDWGAAFYKPILIGTVGPHEHAPIPGFLFQPKADPKTGQDNYWIMLSAQNGTVSQSINFRRDRKNPKNWAYAFQVSRQHFSGKPQSRKMMLKPSDVPKKGRATTYELLLYRNWSDELTEHKK